MAVKRKTTKSQGEQLYMLEVIIDRVTLNPERTPRVAEENLVIRVRFTDLPKCEISVPNKNDGEKNAEDAGGSTEFGYRKSCLFSKTPSCLIRAVRWSPLYLEAHHLESTCPTKEDRVLLGTARISLPACMCTHVAKTQKENKPSSTPCSVKNTYNLIDSDSKTIGNVSVVLRLSCYGSSIVKRFSLHQKSFVLEDSPLQKFLCPYLTPEDKNKDLKNEEGKILLKRPDSPPRISINDPAFKTLTSAEKLNDPKYRELVYKSYPDEPTCCCLPPNNSTHPMICRSGCTRSCCMKLRNPKILDTQKDRHGDDALANTYCVNNSRLMDQYTTCNDQNRLRGGGDLEQIYIGSPTLRWTDEDYTWYRGKPNLESRLDGYLDGRLDGRLDGYLDGRLEGGAEIDMSTCSCSGSPVAVPLRPTSSKDRDVITAFDACQPRHVSTGPKPTCACPGKDASMRPRGAARCTKKPCMGIDCMIRAFENAQEWVNSIGKVPGLRGLGLMDPSESPYFGRDLDKDYVSQEPEVQKKKPHGASQQKAEAPRCTAPCSLPIDRPDDQSRIGAPYTPAASVGLPIPPRLGIVREAIPVLPEVASAGTGKMRKALEKREEKTDKLLDLKAMNDTEIGPCGEPKCKSRRTKPADAMSTTHSETAPVKTREVKKPKSRRKGKSPSSAKGKGKRRRGSPTIGPQIPTGKLGLRVGADSQIKAGARESEKSVRKSPVGPGGDLFSHPQINVSRRIMRYVYYVGDYYPGIVYGHRDCIEIPMRVPANMGWLWNTMTMPGKLKPRLGWKPGAIGRYLYEIMQEAKESTLAAEDSVVSITTKPTERARKAGGGRGTERGKTKIVRGKTMERGKTDKSKMERPRTGPERGRTRETERAKSAPSRSKSSPRRRGDKSRGFQTIQQMKMEGEDEGMEAPPTLHIHRKDGTYYVTMYPIRQETPGEPRLTEPMKPLQFKIVKNKDDASIASSSTASDMEIEFSPPAAVSRYRKKPDVVHVDTQVRQQEILDAVKGDMSRKKDRRKQEAVNTSKMDSNKKRDKRQEMDALKLDPGMRKDKMKKEKKGRK